MTAPAILSKTTFQSIQISKVLYLFDILAQNKTSGAQMYFIVAF